MFENLTTEEVIQMASKVGRRVARRFPGVEADDIASAALTELVRTKDQIKEPTEGNVYKILEKFGIRYADKERYDYIVNSSQYVYTPREVRALLKEAYFVEEMWNTPSGRDDRLSATIEQDVVVVSLLDVEEALGQTSGRYRDVVTRAFYMGEEVDSKELTRAVDDVTKHLNRHINRSKYGHEGPGARRAITNAHSQYLTRNQW